MQITNPTKEKISVLIEGVDYSIEPGGTIENIPESVARNWQENTHKFIQIKKDKLEKTPSPVIVTPPAPEAAEEKESEEESIPVEIARPGDNRRPVIEGVGTVEKEPVEDEEEKEEEPSDEGEPELG